MSILIAGSRNPVNPFQARLTVDEMVKRLDPGMVVLNGGPDDNDVQAGRLVVGAVTSKWSKQSGGPAGDECQNLVLDGGGTLVRRLTPTECERLQGLADGWTDLGGTPNTPRYAALGDAVTATVAHWIGERIP